MNARTHARFRVSPLLALSGLLALGAAPGAAAAPEAPPPLDATTRDYDQEHLVVRVRPDLEEGSVDGEVTVRFSARVDPLRVLRLHCVETTVLAARDGEGRLLEWRVVDGVLAVTLARPVPGGAEGEVTVVYRCRPTAGLYFRRPTRAAPSTPLEMWSQGEGIDNRRWIPCYDEPDDRCTVEVLASVPERLRTVSNGTLVGQRPAGAGLREDHWRIDQRIPTYLVSLVVGHFEKVEDSFDGVPLEYFGPPGRADEIRQGCSATKDAMAFFSEYTGRRYPYPRYAQTAVWDFVFGGMENASATTMNLRLLHRPEDRPVYMSDGLVAHELAHQWFGDLVTCRTWAHIWLNEGFATYFTDLFFGHRDGPEAFAVARWRQNRGYMDGTQRPESLGLSPAPRGDQPLELSGGKAYDRGAAILHQLRLETGDDAFRRGVARYLKEHEDKAAVTEDFRRSFEAVAGQDLKWFFAQWVYGAGYPVVEARTQVEKGPSGEVLRLSLEQTQSAGGGQAEAFRLTVPVAVHRGGEARRLALRLDRRRQSWTVPLPAGDEPPYVRVGEGGGVFARIRTAQPAGAWARGVARDPDPTGRMEACEALLEWPDEAAAALPAVLAGDASWAVRAEAARALARLAAPEATAALLAARADADARVREAVIEALGARGRDAAGAALLEAARGDPNAYVRAAAARAAGRVHAEGAFEALRDLLSADSHREVVRAAALDGLAAIGDRRALEHARRHLAYEWPRGDHQAMREAAVRLMLAIAPDEAETSEALLALLSDPYFRMRQFAAERAGDFRLAAARERLARMAENDPHPGARAAARKALGALGPAR